MLLKHLSGVFLYGWGFFSDVCLSGASAELRYRRKVLQGELKYGVQCTAKFSNIFVMSEFIVLKSILFYSTANIGIY